MNRFTSPRVALVTGGSRGIGKAIALELARAGAQVAVNFISSFSAAQEVVTRIKEASGEAVALPGDVSKAPEADALIDSVLSTYGRLDILINNAGITRDSLLIRMSDVDWQEVLAVDLNGAFYCTRAALRPMLKNRWGRIINISSVVANIGNPGQANYAAAKAGLIGFTKSVAREVASRNITVNAIAPGFIETDLTAKLKEALKEGIVRQIPMGYFGSSEDVASAVVFLASEQARYLTGQVLGVDGGLAMS